MVRPEKALALTAEQAARQPLPAGWNEVSAKVGEVLFLGKAKPAMWSLLVVPNDGQGTVCSGYADAARDSVKVRWAVADACITEWAESDLSKSAGAH